MKSPNTPVAAICLAIASAFVNAQAQERTASETVTQLGAIDVKGAADVEPYALKKAASGTKTDTPLMGTPLSIQVVPRAVRDDQKATTIKDVLENVSGVRAQPLLGGSAGYLIRGYRSHNLYGSDGQWVVPNTALAIDIFNPGPSYGIPRSVFDVALKTSATAPPRSDIYNQWYGLYLQDQVTIERRLHLMLGGRYDWAETGRGRATTFAAATDALFHSTPSVIRKDQGFSPRLGGLYELSPTLSAYGTWTTSFGANNAPATDGRTFDPQVGKQYELGLKAQLFESRLLGTLAAYKLTKDNILVADLSTADPNDRIANKQGSEGIELDLTGRVSRYLSLIASYAYTETKVIEDHAAGSPTKGNRLANVPKHSGSLSVRYDLNGQGANGLNRPAPGRPAAHRGAHGEPAGLLSGA